MHGRPQGAARVDGHTAQRPCNRTSYLIMPLVKPFEGRPLPLVSGVGAAPVVACVSVQRVGES